MSDLDRQFHHYANCHLARVLTQMDRDSDSPTFGCFDRNYWHYKIRDFPSAILQQGVFTLEAVRRGHLKEYGQSSVSPGAIEPWCVGAVQAVARQVSSSGSVDEYYPFERSYPAAAFGLYAIARVLVDWQTDAPHLLAQVDWQPLHRLTRHLTARVEEGAINQQAAALAGLALATRIPALAPAVQGLAEHADRLFQGQHSEGWFNEYGGPDFGYLTVTLDALTDYYDATTDARALVARERAIAFLASLVGADGRLPSTLNCRNTDYVVPYGLVRAAAENPLAAWLVETLFGGMDQPGHFLWATDDRYHCHYIFASIVRSLPHLPAMLPGRSPEFQPCLWLPGCGYWVRHATDRQWTAYVAARKGGLVRVHQRDRPPQVDHGWRLAKGKDRFTTNWWSSDWAIDPQADTVRIQGTCQATRFHVPTPAKHTVLRLLAALFGDRLIPLLKRWMIFRPGASGGTTFERTVRVTETGVTIDDRFSAWQGATVHPSPRQNLRHVASADSFSFEEWQNLLIAAATYRLDRDLHVQTQWQADAETP